MNPRSRRSGIFLTLILSVSLSTVWHSRALSSDERQVSTAQLDSYWRGTLKLAGEGQFEKAAEIIQKIPPQSDLVGVVQKWLDQFQAQQAERRKLDRVDFEKYVGYAKERMDRKEYALALDQALRALDVTEDREAFLREAWLTRLVNDSLAKADEFRKDGKWRNAWHIYVDLGSLFEREPRYKRLENEVLTHLRFEAIFDEKSLWKEQVEHVQWRDAENALELVQLAYVEEPNFKAIAEGGLDHLLMLAESDAVRKTFPGLAYDNDRRDFETRVRENLDQVRAAASVDRRECVRRFRRVRQINQETVRLPEELLVNELMHGALTPLDDFTSVIWPSGTEEFDKHTRGDFIGVGISIIKNRLGEIEVVTPLEDTPAFRAGIQAGDIIAKVDGNEIKELSLTKVVSTITGPQDTRVTLTIRRDEKELLFPLLREKVKIQSVKGWERRPDESWNYWLDRERGIAYIRITNFAKNTVDDVKDIMSELKPHGLRGLVLDLRWNPGGLLDSAWHMASLFLKRGDIVVSTKGRNPNDDQRLPAPSEGAYSDIPLVVLVNANSASASEIVSGAIRDNNRGTVIGERTFGKFSVQNLIPLSSSSAKLKITTARYFLPNGDSLHREPLAETWGVDPDVPVRLGRWENWNAWQLRREADLLGPPKAEVIADASADGPDADLLDGESADDEDADAKDGDATADAEPKLPPLKQPDENNRPKVDPQVDTALLLLRVKLLAERHPTLATAVGQAPAKEQSATP